MPDPDGLQVYQRELRRRIEEAEESRWAELRATRAVAALAIDAAAAAQTAAAQAAALQLQLEQKDRLLAAAELAQAERAAGDAGGARDARRDAKDAERRAAGADAALTSLRGKYEGLAAAHRHLQTEAAESAAELRTLRKAEAAWGDARTQLRRRAERKEAEAAELRVQVQQLAAELGDLTAAGSVPREDRGLLPENLLETRMLEGKASTSASTATEDAASVRPAPPQAADDEFRGYDVAEALRTQRVLTSAAQDEVESLSEELARAKPKLAAALAACAEACDGRDAACDEAARLRAALAEKTEDATRAAEDAERAADAARRAEGNTGDMDAAVAQLEEVLRGMEDAYLSTLEQASAKDVVIEYLSNTLDGAKQGGSAVDRHAATLQALKASLQAFREKEVVQADAIDRLERELDAARSSRGGGGGGGRSGAPDGAAGDDASAASDALSLTPQEAEQLLVTSRDTIQSLHAENTQLRELLRVSEDNAAKAMAEAAAAQRHIEGGGGGAAAAAESSSPQPRRTLSGVGAAETEPHLDPETEGVLAASKQAIEALQAENLRLREKLEDWESTHQHQHHHHHHQQQQQEQQQQHRSLRQPAHQHQQYDWSHDDPQAAPQQHPHYPTTPTSRGGAGAGPAGSVQPKLPAEMAAVMRRNAALEAEAAQLGDALALARRAEEALHAELRARTSAAAAAAETRRDGEASKDDLIEQLRLESSALRESLDAAAAQHTVEEQVMADSKAAIDALQRVITTVQADAAHAAEVHQAEAARMQHELEQCAVYEDRCTAMQGEAGFLTQRCAGLEKDVAELSDSLARAAAEAAALRPLEALHGELDAAVARAAAAERACEESELRAADLHSQAQAAQHALQSERCVLEDRLGHEEQRCAQYQKHAAALGGELRGVNDLIAEKAREGGYLKSRLQQREDELGDRLRKEAQATAAAEARCRTLEAELRSAGAERDEARRRGAAQSDAEHSRAEEWGERCRQEAGRAAEADRRLAAAEQRGQAAEEEAAALRTELAVLRAARDSAPQDGAEQERAARGFERECAALQAELAQAADALRAEQRRAAEAGRGAALAEQKGAAHEANAAALTQALAEARGACGAAEEKVRALKRQQWAEAHADEDRVLGLEAECRRLERELAQAQAAQHGSAHLQDELQRTRRLNEDLQESLNRLREEQTILKSDLQLSSRRGSFPQPPPPPPPPQHLTPRASGLPAAAAGSAAGYALRQSRHEAPSPTSAAAAAAAAAAASAPTAAPQWGGGAAAAAAHTGATLYTPVPLSVNASAASALGTPRLAHIRPTPAPSTSPTHAVDRRSSMIVLP